MRIENDVKLDFSDVLIRPKRSSLNSRKEVELQRTFKFKYSPHTWTVVPIVASNMDTTGTFEMAKALHRHGMSTALHKHYTGLEYEKFLHREYESIDKNELADSLFVSIGSSVKDLERVKIPLRYINKIMIDIANGYSEHFIDCIKRTRDAYPEHVICAGNVVTADMAEALILAGADIVKCGIGNGSVCTTRIQTGVGYPQLSAVIECADAVHGLDGHLMSDGGCNIPADFAKAFGAGADFIMSGSYFAGHDESGCEKHVDQETGELFLKYYGMSSNTAQEKHNGGVNDYRSSEGRTVLIPYKGPVQESCKTLLGGLRSTCTYVGAATIKQLPKRTTFIRVNNTHNRVYEGNTIRL